ncbi:hypothetical protein DPEC_G00223900 [Dallia pectoralis]|uniref:Uncharacterized protein n=1 Tax=Dallia pectoralis TaxID=75939 RepID=A0ACC2G010_DALPE|nr:hypothetical protein DPEC_G00223900 [Dallia pectoralis]
MEYLHYPLKEKLVETLDRYPVQLVTDLDTLELSFNVDGLPLFKSSGKSMWPILCAVMLSPVTIFPTALTCGTKKPTDLAFLEDTVTDLTEVLTNGLDYRKKNIKRERERVVSVCDLRYYAVWTITRPHTRNQNVQLGLFSI